MSPFADLNGQQTFKKMGGITMSEFKNLGIYLKEKRTLAGLTQQQLASALGNIHSQFVSNWERGLCSPPGHCLQELISILNINRDHLVEVMLMDSQNAIRLKIDKKQA